MATENEADAEDGLLQAREIFQLKLSSDLVVLSACQTARGQLLKGDGIKSLAQAFLYAGSKSVVASFWDIEDAQTLKFMTSFYQLLSKGESKAASLRKVKLDMIQSDRNAPPRQWAAFALFGGENSSVSINPVDTKNGSWIYPAFGLTALLSALLFLAYKMRRHKSW